MLARTDALRERGRLRDAIALLVGANRAHRDAHLERELLRVRHDAFNACEPEAVPAPPATSRPRADAGSGYPPTVRAAELSSHALEWAIHGYGCLRVTELVPRAVVSQLVDDIDRTFSAYDAHAAEAATPETHTWYSPFMPAGGPVHLTRPWLRQGGGIFAADSPRTFFDVLETYERCGVIDVVSEFLGERPVVSLAKATLRRVAAGQGITWHQDGAFLGYDARALNIWLSLTETGDAAPGLDLVPRRLHEIVPTGTDDARYSWSVGSPVVDAARQGAPICRPTFAPGDALLFDGYLLHRTSPVGNRDELVVRYAVETWFFTPSSFPAQQEVPLVV